MPFSIYEPLTPRQISLVRDLMWTYVKAGYVDLSSQNIDAEIAGLSGKYSPPTGALFLAIDEQGVPLGCVALHKLGKTADAEIKRLFVRPEYRGLGVGTALLKATINAARAVRCRRIVLDTMPTMTAAIARYKSLGFEQIEAYWDFLQNADVSRR